MQNETIYMKNLLSHIQALCKKFHICLFNTHLGLLDDEIAKDTNKITPILWFVPQNLL